jgi:hypothetical protein
VLRGLLTPRVTGYGFDPSYRNIFVSLQPLRNGMVVDNNIDAHQG